MNAIALRGMRETEFIVKVSAIYLLSEGILPFPSDKMLG